MAEMIICSSCGEAWDTEEYFCGVLLKDNVLFNIISEIEKESSDIGESYITIDKDRLKFILEQYVSK